MSRPHLSFLLPAGVACLVLLACGGTETSTIVKPTSDQTDDPAPAPPLPAPTGVVTGTLKDKKTSAGLGGATVWAVANGSYRVKTIPLSGKILATATTGTDGTFRLEGIPSDRSFRVVSMPDVGTTSYDVSASGSLMLGESSLAIEQDLLARATDQLGSIAMTQPAASQMPYTLSFFQVVGGDAAKEGLLVRVVQLSAGDTFTLQRMPAGEYAVHALLGPNSQGLQREITVPLAVTSGGTFSMDSIAALM